MIGQSAPDVIHANNLKSLFKTMPKKTFIELKAFTGHMKRISFASQSDTAGIRMLIKGISNLVGSMLFSTQFVVPTPAYVYTNLDFGMSFNFDSDENINNETREAQTPTKPAAITTVNSLPLIDDNRNTVIARVPTNTRQKSLDQFNLEGLCLESDLDLSSQWVKYDRNEVESILFHQHSCLPWHGAATDLLVRFWDHIFAPQIKN